jgi:hypothetical protein
MNSKSLKLLALCSGDRPMLGKARRIGAGKACRQQATVLGDLRKARPAARHKMPHQPLLADIAAAGKL